MENRAPHLSILNPKPEHHHTHTFDSPHPIYAMAFSTSSPSPCLAVGSFIEEMNNRVDIVSFDDDGLSLRSDPKLFFEHQYPPTKLMFHPKPLPSQSGSLLASSGEFLRLWQVKESSVELRSVFNNNTSAEFCAPLTSFDWNQAEPRRIGTSSIDTTCTIWDIERGVVETQLIAHDKEVYDIAWGEAGVFASVSADGSVRIFDLRDKEHSAIVYESPRPDTPLLRLAWNKMDLRYMATILMDSNQVVVLDIRSPAVPIAELQRHRASVNAVAWAPQTVNHLCSAGDDGQALIWELPAAAPPEGVDPVLAYQAGAEINQLQWSAAQPDWISIAFSNKVQRPIILLLQPPVEKSKTNSFVRSYKPASLPPELMSSSTTRLRAMGGPFSAYSFSLPKPILHLLLILNITSRAASLILVFLGLRPPPPPPPSRAIGPLFSHASDTPSSPASSAAPLPTPSSMKSQLPVIKYQHLSSGSPSTACVVCLASLEAADEVRELGNCRHAFHVACIDRWIDADGLTCPLCRSPLLPSPEAKVEAEKGIFVKFFSRIRKISLSIKLFISSLYVDNYL